MFGEDLEFYSVRVRVDKVWVEVDGLVCWFILIR